MNKLLTILTVFALLWLPMAACSGSSSPTEPAPPPSNGGGDAPPTTSSVEFVSVFPECGGEALASSRGGIDVRVKYANASAEQAGISVILEDAAGGLVGSGGYDRAIPAESTGTVTVRDVNADAPGRSTKIQIEMISDDSF